MSDIRFIALWNDYLEGELDEAGVAELRNLVTGDDRLMQMAADSYQLHRLLGLAAQDDPLQHDDFVRATMAILPAEDSHFVEAVMRHLPVGATRKRVTTCWLFALAAVVPIVMIVGVYLLVFSADKPIARVTGLSGSLQWTGNGGRIFHDLKVNTELAGGTVEGMSPNSWFELEFNDGSIVTVSGNSMLTFSDLGQKELYLKEGKLFAHVTPQAVGKPLLVATRNMLVEVLGTRFSAEVESGATVLNVSEGKVRAKRLRDGVTVDVPAQYRVVAGADREMQAVPVPDAVGRWKSQLHLGPERLYGKWSPPTPDEGATLKTIPLTLPQGWTIYAAALGVSRGDSPPVVLQPACRLRVLGKIDAPHTVYFGVSVRYIGGGFAGKFQMARPANAFVPGEAFEMLLDLRDFELDPTLGEINDKLPATPFHLVVESMWCHTLDQPAGLEISEVELQLPQNAQEGSPLEPSKLPVKDIWAAASQGDVDTIKRHLAAGIDIDTIFIAPGVIASGATPLHMAILSDQREAARLLIDHGANINTPAQDEYGGAPLHWAAVLGRVDIARYLLDAGAEVNLQDKNGYTPLDATSLEQFSESEPREVIANLIRQRGGKNGDAHSDSESALKE